MTDESRTSGNVRRILVSTRHEGDWITRRVYQMSDCDVPLQTIEMPMSVFTGTVTNKRFVAQLAAFQRGRAKTVKTRELHQRVCLLLSTTKASARRIASMVGVTEATVSYIAKKYDIRQNKNRV